MFFFKRLCFSYEASLRGNSGPSVASSFLLLCVKCSGWKMNIGKQIQPVNANLSGISILITLFSPVEGDVVSFDQSCFVLCHALRSPCHHTPGSCFQLVISFPCNDYPWHVEASGPQFNLVRLFSSVAHLSCLGLFINVLSSSHRPVSYSPTKNAALPES